MKDFITKILHIILLSISLQALAVIPEKVVICGVCRDVAKQLPHMIQNIEKIGTLFSDYRVIISEYNSDDNTPTLLYRWMRNNPKVSVQVVYIPNASFETWVVNITEDRKFFHPEQTAHARNGVLSNAMSQAYQDFSYVIWIDMDSLISPTLEGFIEIFQADREWDAIFAYGVDLTGSYKGCNAHRDSVYPIGSELLGDAWSNLNIRCELSETADWYPVYSAFGGCGIYKKSSIVGCQYSALITDDLEKLTKQLIAQGRSMQHPQIMKYLGDLEKLSKIHCINYPFPNLPKITDPTIGIITHEQNDPIIWKMNSFVYQYPAVCEHIPMHATMIINGHDKLFINPRLIMTYLE